MRFLVPAATLGLLILAPAAPAVGGLVVVAAGTVEYARADCATGAIVEFSYHAMLAPNEGTIAFAARECTHYQWNVLDCGTDSARTVTCIGPALWMRLQPDGGFTALGPTYWMQGSLVRPWR